MNILFSDCTPQLVSSAPPMPPPRIHHHTQVPPITHICSTTRLSPNHLLSIDAYAPSLFHHDSDDIGVHQSQHNGLACQLQQTSPCIRCDCQGMCCCNPGLSLDG